MFNGNSFGKHFEIYDLGYDIFFPEISERGCPSHWGFRKQKLF
jgi:hypothetical protein